MDIEITRDEILEKLLKIYSTYFDVEQCQQEFLVAKCQFHVHSEKYVLVKKAKLWEHDCNEFVYIFSMSHLTEEVYRKCEKYAYEQGIHPAVISYLELRRKNFYRMENTADGRIFATARGWEDLSRLIQVYETLGKEVDREVVYQYIQHPMVAKDFASYLALYNKYKTDYAVEDLLQGKWTPITLGKIRNASLDEHLSIVGLLNGKLSQLFADCYLMDAYVTKLYGYMTEYRDNLPEMTLESIYKKAENDFYTAKKSELLTKNEEKVFIRTVNFFENEISEKGTYEQTKTAFTAEADSLETQTEYISKTLQNVFDFMEAAFGDSQEMVAFITELNANFYSIWFIRENGSDQYYRHNKGLLFDDRQKLILGQMEELENTMKRGLKN